MRLNSLLRACWVLALCAAPAFAFALADTSATLATAINIPSGPASIEGLRSGLRGQPREPPPRRCPTRSKPRPAAPATRRSSSMTIQNAALDRPRPNTPALVPRRHPSARARFRTMRSPTCARGAPARGDGPERRQDERDLRRPRLGCRDPLRRLGRAADHAPSTLRPSIITEMHRSSPRLSSSPPTSTASARPRLRVRVLVIARRRVELDCRQVQPERAQSQRRLSGLRYAKIWHKVVSIFEYLK